MKVCYGPFAAQIEHFDWWIQEDSAFHGDEIEKLLDASVLESVRCRIGPDTLSRFTQSYLSRFTVPNSTYDRDEYGNVFAKYVNRAGNRIGEYLDVFAHALEWSLDFEGPSTSRVNLVLLCAYIDEMAIAPQDVEAMLERLRLLLPIQKLATYLKICFFLKTPKDVAQEIGSLCLTPASGFDALACVANSMGLQLGQETEWSLSKLIRLLGLLDDSTGLGDTM